MHCSLSCLADRLLHQDWISASNMICEVSAHEPCQCWNKRSLEVPKFSRIIWLSSCCWGSQVWENEKTQVTHLYGKFLFAILQRFPSFLIETWHETRDECRSDNSWMMMNGMRSYRLMKSGWRKKGLGTMIFVQVLRSTIPWFLRGTIPWF